MSDKTYLLYIIVIVIIVVVVTSYKVRILTEFLYSANGFYF